MSTLVELYFASEIVRGEVELGSTRLSDVLNNSLEPSILLLLFYSLFADMWLNPITYILIIITIVFKRYVSSRRVVLV